MTCFNRNTTQFKALQAKYDNPLFVDSLITKWQQVSKTDNLPTVTQVETYLGQQEKLLDLKKGKYINDLMSNLGDKNLVTLYKGDYYINNTDSKSLNVTKENLQDNVNRVNRYLNIWNIPADAVTMYPSKNSFRISIDKSKVTESDVNELEKGRKEKTHILDVLDHMTTMFPEVSVDIVTEQEAKEHYDSLPQWRKSQIENFDNVKSYFVDGVAKLIQGRVDSETAIEEVLHPFVGSIFITNNKLFNSLLSEAKINFPELDDLINDEYKNEFGFEQKTRDLELVTKALSNHFNNEYENKPTQGWLMKISQLLKALSDIIKNLYKYISGKNLIIPTSVISSSSTLTDVAKLLNTNDLQFTLEKEALSDTKVQFSLSPERSKLFKYLKGQARENDNTAQLKMIERLFGAAEAADQTLEDFTASAYFQDQATALVKLEKETHTYVDVLNPTAIYESVTKKMKGEMKDPNNWYEVNRDLGDDFDSIMTSLALMLPFEQLPKMKVLKGADVKMAWQVLNASLEGMRTMGTVIIPQVVVADQASGTAGTIDLLAVHADGTLSIIDLKTSKNSKFDSNYDTPYSVNEGSVLKGLPQEGISTRMQQGIQVNTYRQMLQNMGYTVRDDATTYHIRVEMTGEKKEQKFTGNIEVEGSTVHKPSQNMSWVEQIVPENINEEMQKKLDQEQIDAGNVLDPLTDQEAKPIEDELDSDTYRILFNALKDFKVKLVSRKEGIELLQPGVRQSEEIQERLSEIDMAISQINVALVRGTADVVYEKLLQSTMNDIDKMSTYIKSPRNFGKKEYITKVLNFNKLVETYEGLVNISGAEGLNNRQLKLKEKLQTKLNEVVGIGNKQGLIAEAIENYVRKVVKDTSLRGDKMTEEDLDAIMTEAKDMGAGEYYSGTAATSKDTLLALMDKIWKRQRQKAIDRIEARNNQVRRVLNKLEKLSPRGNVKFDYMLQYDSKGNFTGRYVQKIGYEYWKTRADIRKNLYYADGSRKEYIIKDNLSDYSIEEKRFNTELFEAKAEFKKFMQAERKDQRGILVDGDYHKYSNEFKRIRSQYETWINVGRNGSWKKKSGVTDVEYRLYKQKYFHEIKVNFYDYDSRMNFTGLVKPATTMEVPKSRVGDMVILERRDVSSARTGSKDMIDPKYRKIMNPNPGDSLALAQKEFYETYDQFYNEMLEQLPQAVRDQMLGKSPVIADRTLRNIVKEGNALTRMWAKTKRNVGDFFSTSWQNENTIVDENGNIVDTLPIFYVGNPRSDNALKDIDGKIDQLLKDYENPKNKMSEKEYLDLKEDLKIKRKRILAQPLKTELSQDMGDNLLRFIAMAENYEVMNEVKDTLESMLSVMKGRKTTPVGYKRMMATVKGKRQKIGVDASTSNLYLRAKKWMNMVYYDNDKKTRHIGDKLAAGLIGLSSFTYVAWNPWGNFNNYVIGRINNRIEQAGGRFYDRKAYARAEAEFNLKALPDIFSSLGDSSTWAEVTGGRGKYKERVPRSKYVALVDHFRMMDAKADIREQNRAKGKQSRLRTFMSWGYLLQDGAEYNVQTKVGMAILMSRKVRNAAGEELSLYDAYQYNNKTGEISLKEGFDIFVDDKNGQTKNQEEYQLKEYTDDVRYDIRNNIREVNIHIHGNYAHEDRMVMQQHWLGNLAAQFHKWVAPAIKARFRGEYFDENLGWLEGRYRTFASLMHHVWKTKAGLDKAAKTPGFFTHPEKGANRLKNIWRVAAELTLMLSSFGMAMLLDAMLDDEDEDKSLVAKRFENAMIYQFRRQGREMLFFVPVFGFDEFFMMAKSPIAATRTLGELGEAIEMSVAHPFMSIFGTTIFGEDYDMRGDKDYYYQRGKRKGMSKLGKNWGDVIPGWYSWQRWLNYDKRQDFNVK